MLRTCPQTFCCAGAGINQPQALNLGSLFGTEQGLLRDSKREQAVKESGVPYTIVRAGKIKNRPGADMQLEISQQDQQMSGDIRCCPRCLTTVCVVSPFVACQLAGMLLCQYCEIILIPFLIPFFAKVYE